MDFEVGNVLWGIVAVVMARKFWNMMVSQETKREALSGRHTEMREIDPTSMPSQPVYEAVGPFAVKTNL
jgi:hypothetical protein